MYHKCIQYKKRNIKTASGSIYIHSFLQKHHISPRNMGQFKTSDLAISHDLSHALTEVAALKLKLLFLKCKPGSSHTYLHGRAFYAADKKS